MDLMLSQCHRLHLSPDRLADGQFKVGGGATDAKAMGAALVAHAAPVLA
jgi:hypothetical protein